MDRTGRRVVTILSWVAVAFVLWLAAWSVLDGSDPALMIGVAGVCGLVAGGVIAGVICWKRGRHLVALVGLLAPFLPLVGHYLALALGPTDVWAPTMAGDLAGIAAAIAASLAAIAGASIAPEPRAV